MSTQVHQAHRAAAKAKEQMLQMTPTQRRKMMMALRRKPAETMEYLLGERYTLKQKEIFNAVFFGKKRKTSVKAANGVGKSFIAARIALAYLLAYPGSWVIVVGPTQETLRGIFFTELSMALGNDQYGFFKDITETDMRATIRKGWLIEGRVSNKRENLLGRHRKRMLVIIDEASGIESWVMGALGSWVTLPTNKIFMIGNATRNVGPFYESFRSMSKQYNTLTISVFDTPNWTGEVLPASVMENMPSKHWEKEERETAELTRRMHEYQWKIMAEFPTQSAFSLFNSLRIDEAMKRELPDNDPYVLNSTPVVGADIARGGDDRTVVLLSEGYRVKELGQAGAMTIDENIEFIAELSRRAFQEMKETKAEYGVELEWVAIHVDFDGMGSGVYDGLKKIFARDRRFRVFAYQGGRGVYDPANLENYDNRRSESWFALSDILNSEECDFPNVESVKSELMAAEYSHTGKLQQRAVEPKKATKKRLGGLSPDYADTLVICFSPLDEVVGVIQRIGD